MYDVCMECRNLGSNERWVFNFYCAFVALAVTGCAWFDGGCCASCGTTTYIESEQHESEWNGRKVD